ncbi:hypothetical protein Ga0451573_001489 [Peptococcaceae bacterium DYL19]|nr:hypothetical protein [Phosphitispora fastidiosa]
MPLNEEKKNILEKISTMTTIMITSKSMVTTEKRLMM